MSPIFMSLPDYSGDTLCGTVGPKGGAVIGGVALPRLEAARLRDWLTGALDGPDAERKWAIAEEVVVEAPALDDFDMIHLRKWAVDQAMAAPCTPDTNRCVFAESLVRFALRGEVA